MAANIFITVVNKKYPQILKYIEEIVLPIDEFFSTLIALIVRT